MKLISELIGTRKQQLANARQGALLATHAEKGSREWRAFNPLRDDVVHAYPVRAPNKPIVITQPHRVLRIIYPPSRATRVA